MFAAILRKKLGPTARKPQVCTAKDAISSDFVEQTNINPVPWQDCFCWNRRRRPTLRQQAFSGARSAGLDEVVAKTDRRLPDANPRSNDA